MLTRFLIQLAPNTKKYPEILEVSAKEKSLQSLSFKTLMRLVDGICRLMKEKRTCSGPFLVGSKSQLEK